MAWSDAQAARESKGFVKMAVDKDAVRLVILTEPVVRRKLGMRGNTTTRYYFGVLEGKDLKVLDASGKTLDEIALKTKRKVPCKVTLTRHGGANDVATHYVAEVIKATDEDRMLALDPSIVKAANEMASGLIQAPPTLTDPVTGETFQTEDDDVIPF